MGEGLRQSVDGAFGDYLGQIGFSLDEGELIRYAKPTIDGRACLAFTSRKNTGGDVLLTVHVGSEFPTVDELTTLESGQPYLSFFRPIGNLLDPPRYREWAISDSVSREISTEILNLIRCVALPFLESRASIADVLDLLVHGKERFSLDPQQRTAAIAVMKFILGKQEQAIDELTVAIQNEPEWPPKFRAPLVHILRGLQSHLND